MLATEFQTEALFWLSGRGVGKARPRTNCRTGMIYTAQKYGDWKENAISAIALQMQNYPPAPIPCRVECQFINFFSSDADNLQGSVLDALVQANYLENDSSSFVSSCSGTFFKVRKRHNQPKPQGILVKVTPAEIEFLELNYFVSNLLL